MAYLRGLQNYEHATPAQSSVGAISRTPLSVDSQLVPLSNILAEAFAVAVAPTEVAPSMEMAAAEASEFD
ncbi:UNVERIFIED_CONTAM: hypothetical protein DES50_108208 [Williamsia faeni]